MRSHRLIGGSVALLLVLAVPGQARQTKAEPVRLPAAVMDAVKARWPGVQIETFKRDKGAWKVDLQGDERSWQATFSQAGELLETEEDLDAAALPDPVRQAVEKRFPGAAITSVERETTGDGKKAKVVYDVETTKGKLKVDPNGKVLKST